MTVRHETDRTAQIVTTPPTSELLSSADRSVNIWPEIAVNTPDFITQIDRHEAIVRSVVTVLDSTVDPTIRVDELYEDGVLSTSQVIEFYDSLTTLLLDPETTRLALYLPFEYLPERGWEVDDMQLHSTLVNFQSAFMSSWYSLLSIHDARANFIDGDVLEVEHREGDLPRVVKVAELAPMLVSLGYITISELTDIYNNTKDPVLQRDLGAVISSISSVDNVDVDRPSEMRPNNIKEIKIKIDSVANDMVVSFPESVTPNRLDWLRQEYRSQAISRIAKDLSISLIDADNIDRLASDVLDCIDQETSLAVLIEGIRVAIETSFINGDDASSFFIKYDEIIKKLSVNASQETMARINRLLRHVYHMGLITETELTSRGVKPANLSGDLSHNLANIPEDVYTIENLVRDIMLDPELSSAIFPVVSIGGSHLKGYGDVNSDIDLCVFIRPDVPLSNIELIRERLNALFEDTWKQDQPIEFWLSGDDNLQITKSGKPDMYRADEYWTHILFNTAWIGDQHEIELIIKKLIPGYFIDSDTDLEIQLDRQLYLQRIEQDLLQYRLLHKGYQRHFPLVRGRYTPALNHTDESDVFWDPGYRRLASKLFVEKVFLPRIK
jgi:hypothetical protein